MPYSIQACISHNKLRVFLPTIFRVTVLDIGNKAVLNLKRVKANEQVEQTDVMRLRPNPDSAYEYSVVSCNRKT